MLSWRNLAVAAVLLASCSLSLGFVIPADQTMPLDGVVDANIEVYGVGTLGSGTATTTDNFSVHGYVNGDQLLESQQLQGTLDVGRNLWVGGGAGLMNLAADMAIAETLTVEDGSWQQVGGGISFSGESHLSRSSMDLTSVSLSLDASLRPGLDQRGSLMLHDNSHLELVNSSIVAAAPIPGGPVVTGEVTANEGSVVLLDASVLNLEEAASSWLSLADSGVALTARNSSSVSVKYADISHQAQLVLEDSSLSVQYSINAGNGGHISLTDSNAMLGDLGIRESSVFQQTGGTTIITDRIEMTRENENTPTASITGGALQVTGDHGNIHAGTFSATDSDMSFVNLHTSYEGTVLQIDGGSLSFADEMTVSDGASAWLTGSSDDKLLVRRGEGGLNRGGLYIVSGGSLTMENVDYSISGGDHNSIYLQGASLTVTDSQLSAGSYNLEGADTNLQFVGSSIAGRWITFRGIEANSTDSTFVPEEEMGVFDNSILTFTGQNIIQGPGLFSVGATVVVGSTNELQFHPTAVAVGDRLDVTCGNASINGTVIAGHNGQVAFGNETPASHWYTENDASLQLHEDGKFIFGGETTLPSLAKVELMDTPWACSPVELIGTVYGNYDTLTMDEEGPRFLVRGGSLIDGTIDCPVDAVMFVFDKYVRPDGNYARITNVQFNSLVDAYGSLDIDNSCGFGGTFQTMSTAYAPPYDDATIRIINDTLLSGPGQLVLNWRSSNNWTIVQAHPDTPEAGLYITSDLTINASRTRFENMRVVENSGTIFFENGDNEISAPLENYGTISAGCWGKIALLSGSEIYNHGLIEAIDGGGVQIGAVGSYWENMGTLRIDGENASANSPSVLVLGGSFGIHSIGNVERIGHNRLCISGDLDLDGEELDLDSTGTIALRNGTIRNGTITVYPDATLTFDPAFGMRGYFKDQVTINGDLAISGHTLEAQQLVMNGNLSTETDYPIQFRGYDMSLGGSANVSFVRSGIWTYDGINARDGESPGATFAVGPDVVFNTPYGIVRADNMVFEGVFLAAERPDRYGQCQLDVIDTLTNYGTIREIRTGENPGMMLINAQTLINYGTLDVESHRITVASLILAGGSVAGDYTVADGKTFGGSGTIGGTLTARPGSVISPGSSPGHLSMQNLVLDPLSTLVMEIGGTDPASYDQMLVEQTATLAGALLLSLESGYSPLPGDTAYLIARLDGDGFFDGMTEGMQILIDSMPAIITYQANWTGSALTSSWTGGNDVGVMFVPEPACSALILLGLPLLILRRRR
jgi:hypothetical protein